MSRSPSNESPDSMPTPQQSLATSISSSSSASASASNNDKNIAETFKARYPIIKDSNDTYHSPDIPLREILQIKRILKEEGIQHFIDRYLPEPTTGEDILRLIYLLGNQNLEVDYDLNDDSNMAKIVESLKSSLQIIYNSRKKRDDIVIPDGIRSLVKEAHNVVIITGPGVDKALGIPNYLSCDDEKLQQEIKGLGLNDINEIFNMDLFDVNPEVFFKTIRHFIPPSELSKDQLPHAYKLIKKLSDKGKLLRNYTQCITSIHETLNLPLDEVVELNGSITGSTCLNCHSQIPTSKIYEAINTPAIPLCPRCASYRHSKQTKDINFFPQSLGVFKPDINFHPKKETLEFKSQLRKDLLKCDLVIMIGVDSSYYPALDFAESVGKEVPQVWIHEQDLPRVQGEVDLALVCDCEKISKWLLKKLGWSGSDEEEDEVMWNRDDEFDYVFYG